MFEATLNPLFEVTLNPFRHGQFQGAHGSVRVTLPVEAIHALDALPRDVLWVSPVGEAFKIDYEVCSGQTASISAGCK